MVISSKKFENNLLKFLLLMLFFIIDAVFRIRDYEDKGIDFQVAFKFILFIFAFFMSFRYVLKVGVFSFIQKNLMIVLLLFWLLATSLYAVDSFYSLYISLTYFSFFVFLSYSLRTLNFEGVASILYYSILLFMIVSLYLYVFEPEVGRFVFWNDGILEPSWRMSGLAGSANNFSRIISLAFIVVLFNWSFFRTKHSLHALFLYLSIAALCVLLSGSRTTIIFMMATIAAYYYLRLERKSKAYTFLIFVVLAFVAYFSINIIVDIISRTDGEDLSSFTGRDVIWRMASSLIEDSIWLGYGLGSSVYLLPDLSDILGFSPAHAHNMYLQLTLNGGLVGLILFICTTLHAVVKLRRNRDVQFLCYLLFVMLVGIFESGAFALSANIFTLLYFLCISVANDLRSEQLASQNEAS